MRESGRGSNARSCNRMDDVVIELRQRRVALTNLCGAPRRPERCLPTCLPRRDKIQSARVHPDRDTVRAHAGTRGSNTSVPVRNGRSARTAVTLPAHMTLISATPGSGKHCATRDRGARGIYPTRSCAPQGRERAARGHPVRRPHAGDRSADGPSALQPYTLQASRAAHPPSGLSNAPPQGMAKGSGMAKPANAIAARELRAGATNWPDIDPT